MSERAITIQKMIAAWNKTAAEGGNTEELMGAALDVAVARAAAPLPAQEVSDAMVERACAAYWASDLSWDDPRHRQEGKDAERRDMRFALEAALHPAKD